jgi:hypothetical protein
MRGLSQTLAREAFNKAFRYARGPRFADGWRDARETRRGDCDDFALSTLLILSGNWREALYDLVTFRASFWLVWSKQSGLLPSHVVLRHSGMWICSTYRQPSPNFRHRLMPIPLVLPWALFRIFWGVTIGRFFK